MEVRRKKITIVLLVACWYVLNHCFFGRKPPCFPRAHQFVWCKYCSHAGFKNFTVLSLSTVMNNRSQLALLNVSSWLQDTIV